jgi:hypothetical protein
MDLRPTNADEKLQFRTATSRAATVKECPWAFSPPMVMKYLQFRTVANRAATGKERYATAPFPSVFSRERYATSSFPTVFSTGR